MTAQAALPAAEAQAHPTTAVAAPTVIDSLEKLIYDSAINWHRHIDKNIKTAVPQANVEQRFYKLPSN